MFATKFKNSAYSTCWLISVLSRKNLTNFTMYSVDGFANRGQGTTMRSFSLKALNQIINILFNQHVQQLLKLDVIKLIKVLSVRWFLDSCSIELVLFSSSASAGIPVWDYYYQLSQRIHQQWSLDSMYHDHLLFSLATQLYWIMDIYIYYV